jgi:hypothetical protein
MTRQICYNEFLNNNFKLVMYFVKISSLIYNLNLRYIILILLSHKFVLIFNILLMICVK